MKVVFSALHFASFRNFESVVRALADRGHQVHLLADEPERFGGQALVEGLAAQYTAVSWGWTPSPASEAWFPFAQKVRLALDYVRYLDPRYADAPKLRLRNIERAPRIVRWLTSGPVGAVVGHRVVARTLKWLERRMPRSAAIERWLEEQRPDVLLLASLTFSRSLQIEQLKAAKALGIPTAACIMSWDHLSSKTLLHIQPHLTIVWNEVQKQEAVDMHGLPAGAVVVTGAQCYDQWFDRRPARSRDAFCQSMGLDPSRPFVLYVCSAMSPVPDPVEPMFVRQWIEALRSSANPRLKDAGVLVRPHPERVREWNDVNLDGLDNVVLHGRTPIDSDAKADYFDALYFSEAVVGLCTSAFLEAAIVGRPVMTLLLPAYRIHQDGMAHFRYLLKVGGGLLQTAPDVDAHLAQLADVLAGSRERDERNKRFITAFVRPMGLESPATPVFVDAVERLAAAGPCQPDHVLTRRSPANGFVSQLAAAANAGIGRWLLMDTLDIEHAAFERERDASKQEILHARDDQREQERGARDERLKAKEEQRRQKASTRSSQQRAKNWQKWRRALSPSRQLARIKGGVKQIFLPRRDGL
ncbi:MAG TPA: hypothetical protein VI485_22300 [Vicinamibacterales bacterium]|nr:hypothetical protein [Vicinamibacterales bacterium]